MSLVVGLVAGADDPVADVECDHGRVGPGESAWHRLRANGALYVAEAGSGGPGPCIPSPVFPNPPRCYGETAP